MTREEAKTILNKYLTNVNLIKHSLAAEAAMKALYKRLNPTFDPLEEEKWGIVGLMHDADYELCKGHPEQHGLLLFEKEQNIPEDIAHAIKAHNFENTKVEPQNKMAWAIACCDQLTGLIVAATLVRPEKRLSAVTPNFVIGKFKEKSFAKGADRNAILRAEKYLEIPLSEFVQIVLSSMQEISSQLGL